MIKKVSILLAFTFIFIFNCNFSISSEKYKLFGKSREQYKKALVFTPLLKEPPAFFDFRIILDNVGINNRLETNGNIDNLVNYISGQGVYKYSILYILTHASTSGFSIELYDTESERNKRFQSLNNDPRFAGKNYFKIGGAEGKYGISITHSFIYDYFKQNDSLVILMGCQASLWGPNAFNPAGAVATIEQPQPIYGSPKTTLNEEMVEKDLPNLMKALSGRRRKEDINNSIGEINRSGEEILKYTSIFLSDMDKGHYVLYHQPRIDSVEVKARKKGSTGTFDRLIYKYSYSGKNKFNPIEEYPGAESLEKAHKGFIKKDDELHLTIDFSKKILLNKQSISFGANDEPDYSFKLCTYNATNKKIDFEKCIDIEENSLISYEYDLDDNQQPTSNISNSSNRISFRFDLTEFDEKEVSLNSATNLCLVIKAVDSYVFDGMHYLDTDGDGREDEIISETVDKYSENQAYIPSSKDGLDTNHWFWTAPGVEVKQAQVYKLHLPMVFEGEEPPSAANLQPLRSDGVIPLDWKKIGYLYSRCVALPA